MAGSRFLNFRENPIFTLVTEMAVKGLQGAVTVIGLISVVKKIC
jgi:hypothetical protein